MYETKEVNVREKGEKNSYLQKGEKEKKRAKGLELLLHKNGDFKYIRKQKRTKNCLSTSFSAADFRILRQKFCTILKTSN